MSSLEVIEHSSSSYGPRTWHNAKAADLTVAFAINFETRGEQLTKKAAWPNYVGISLSHAPAFAAAMLEEFRAKQEMRDTLNVAGNGIYTLKKFGWDQGRVNRWVYETLLRAHRSVQFMHVYTGGQTGVDLAGAVAAYALAIPCTVTMPLGYIQRDEYGRDASHTEDGIRGQIEGGAAELLRNPS